MENPQPLTCTVIRVMRPDTLLIRMSCPQVMGRVSMYCTLMGVSDFTDECKQAIVDWCELHQDGGRLLFLTADWLRDSYGRLLVDLMDIQSRECLTDHLIDYGYCQENSSHIIECVRDMMASEEITE